MKGKVYPGTFLGALLDEERMQSRDVSIFGPDSGLYCDIDFIADGAGLIEAINYSGNDCG
jgi:hypothetical protein